MQKIIDNIFLFKFFLKFQDFLGYTNVFVVVGEKFVFVCDTSSKPSEMVEIKSFIEKNYPSHKIVVFNSHSDFDHFGGNQTFENEIIISTELCKINIGKSANKPTIPNITFKKNLYFPSEKANFFFSPAHTADSASCYFEKEKFLFCGDNVENPYPYYKKELLKTHIKTLELYKKIDFKILAFGHGDVAYNKKIIDNNIEYLKEKLYENR